MLFVKPWEEEQELGEFMDFVIQQEKSGKVDGEVRYAQTRSWSFISYFLFNALHFVGHYTTSIRNTTYFSRIS
jgi:hypothetical protein